MKNDLIMKMKHIYWGITPEIKEWKRSLIFAIPGKSGEFFRRIYAKKNFKHCGKNLKMYPHVRIYNPDKLEVGNNVVFADYVQISSGGGVTLGDYVGIGPFVKIWSINHNIDRTDIPITEQGWTTEPIIIEEDSWIGAGVIILPGAHIGKGSVISAGSVVGKKHIKPFSVIAGNPGRIIGTRNASGE